MSTIVHPLSVMVVGTAAVAGVGGYVLLYLGVAASWVGVQIVGAGVLAAAGVLASEVLGQLSPRRGTLALVVSAITLIAVVIAVRGRHRAGTN